MSPVDRPARNGAAVKLSGEQLGEAGYCEVDEAVARRADQSVLDQSAAVDVDVLTGRRQVLADLANPSGSTGASHPVEEVTLAARKVLDNPARDRVDDLAGRLGDRLDRVGQADRVVSYPLVGVVADELQHVGAALACVDQSYDGTVLDRDAAQSGRLAQPDANLVVGQRGDRRVVTARQECRP